MTNNWNYLLSCVAVVGGVFSSSCSGEARSATAQQAGAPVARAAAAAEFTVDTATVRLPLELPAQLYVEHDAVVVARSAGTARSVDSAYSSRLSSRRGPDCRARRST